MTNQAQLQFSQFPPPMQPVVPDSADASRRPGWLTALAVFNFILAVMSLLFAASIFIFFMAIQSVPLKIDEPIFTPAGFCPPSINSILLLISGIGYLKQSKVMGRLFGILYGVAAIAGGIVQIVCGIEVILVLIWMVYPVLTLILVNTVFRKCWK